MKFRQLKTTVILCLPSARLYARTRRRRRAGSINTLRSNLLSAMPKAPLTDDQITKLQVDIDSIQAELEAARRGAFPDRDMILWMVNDIRKIVDSDQPPPSF